MPSISSLRHSRSLRFVLCRSRNFLFLSSRRSTVFCAVVAAACVGVRLTINTHSHLMYHLCRCVQHIISYFLLRIPFALKRHFAVSLLSTLAALQSLAAPFSVGVRERRYRFFRWPRSDAERERETEQLRVKRRTAAFANAFECVEASTVRHSARSHHRHARRSRCNDFPPLIRRRRLFVAEKKIYNCSDSEPFQSSYLSASPFSVSRTSATEPCLESFHYFYDTLEQPSARCSSPAPADRCPRRARATDAAVQTCVRECACENKNKTDHFQPRLFLRSLLAASRGNKYFKSP